MRKVFVLFWLLLLTMKASYSQDTLSTWSPKTVYGEWFMLDYDGLTDDIYFRPDSTYMVYNEMDVIYYPNSSVPDTTQVSTVLYDNTLETARTEVGKWIFNAETRQLILTEREFLRPDSHFSKVFGKEEGLVIDVKRLSKGVFTMCPENKDYCLRYRNYLSPSPVGSHGPKVEYGNIYINITGIGTQEYLTYLSGHQTSMVLDYTLHSIEDSIIFKNLKGELIGSITGRNGLSGHAKFEMNGVTELTYEIISDGAWKVKIDIK